MSADPSHVELLVPPDDRLIAAVEAVVAHASERVGLSAEERAELTMATEEACDETFAQATRNGAQNPLLRIVVSDFADRVEVSIEESSGSPPSTAQAPAAAFSAAQPDALNTAFQEIKIDPLHHERRGGKARTVLVKHHSSAKPRPHR
jgi:hypothetical protein